MLLEKYFVDEGISVEFGLSQPEIVFRVWRCDLGTKQLSLVDEDRVTINQRKLLEYNVKEEVVLTFKIAEL